MTPHRKTALGLVGMVAVMASLSFAAVPFYNWFCKVTGFGGTTGVADAGQDIILDRTMKINFDASKEAGMPWDFRPVEYQMTVRIGETNLAYYEAYNPTDRPVAGTASYNVFPYSAGGYFTKIECFCFREQILQPGERVRMPVSFYVDPAIVDDPEAKDLRTITLSYTFHETPLTAEQAARATAKPVPVN
ncbi:MAG: cytochrome c oxidase assembly protein [Pseudomonadota bacterium]